MVDLPTAPEERPEPHEEPLKPYRTILSQEIRQAVEELRRPLQGLFMSGLTAGFSLGIGPFLAALVISRSAATLSSQMALTMAALVYPIGFVVVILARMDLFTEYTTLTVLPVLTGRASLGSVARLWALTYIGNMVGACLFVLLMLILGPALELNLLDAIAHKAEILVKPAWWAILTSAFFTGWLMGLLSWLCGPPWATPSAASSLPPPYATPCACTPNTATGDEATVNNRTSKKCRADPVNLATKEGFSPGSTTVNQSFRPYW